jgi:hypothetical protein
MAIQIKKSIYNYVHGHINKKIMNNQNNILKCFTAVITRSTIIISGDAPPS